MSKKQTKRGKQKEKVMEVKLAQCNAGAVQYFSTKTDTKYQLVKYWHEALGHASKADMLGIIEMDHGSRPLGIPKELTATAIRKWYDTTCEACLASNMRQKPVPKGSPTKYAPGECFAMDIAKFEDALPSSSVIDSFDH